VPVSLLAELPSPSTNVVRFGPLTFRLYGLAIAVGVIAAVWLAGRRWRAVGGEGDDVYAIALWAVPAGLVGARLWHVVTDNQLYRDHPLRAFELWTGGLGIPGGILVGVTTGAWVAHRRHMRLPVALDAIIPALPLAQAIGRLGNWFNQEIFGRPTSLPWGLRIDSANRPAEYAAATTFHPTFAYEALWNLALCGLLILLDRRRVLARGKLLGVYLLGYGIGRLWIEALRSDRANTILGLRVNTWTSFALITIGCVVILWHGWRSRPDDDESPYEPNRGSTPAKHEMNPEQMDGDHDDSDSGVTNGTDDQGQ
jgi:prolipoprotein diacylglyceryl transferase